MINISEVQIERWIKEGVQNSINSALRDTYGVGRDLKEAMNKAIKESEGQIVAAMKIGIAQACVSPNFLQAIEKDIAAELASRYRGAFEGVIRAAAKQAASDELVARRVSELAKKAAGIE